MVRGRVLAMTGVALVALTGAAGAETNDASREADMVVTGSRLPIARDRIGSAITVLTGQSLEEQGIRYVADALQEVPGFAVSRTGAAGGQTQIRVRGLEGNHILVLIDGVEVAPAGSGEFDFSSLLTSDIERIEVVRGPQSGVYGSNAMAGVVQIITKGNGDTGVTGSVEGGSYGTYQVTGSGRVAGEKGFLTLTGAQRQTDGFSVAPGGSENDGDRTSGVSSRGRFIVSDAFRLDGNFHYDDKHLETDDQDFSGGPLQGQVIDSDGFINRSDLTAGATGTLSLLDRKWVSTAAIAYTHNRSHGFSSGSDYGERDERTRLTATTSYDFTLGPVGNTVVGFIEHQRESYRNTYPFDPSQEGRLDREETSIGGEYHLDPMQGLSLSGALRHDDNDSFKDATTFRLAGSYSIAPTGSRLHASYGTGITNPTFTEQFGFIPGQFVGNPDLRPEKVKSWDAGIEQTIVSGRLTLDATYFHSTLEDEIMSIYPSSINAAGQSHRKGVELSLTAHPMASLDLTGSYSFVDARDPDGTQAVRRPRHMANLNAAYRFLADRAMLDLGVVYNGRMFDNDYRGGFTPVKTALSSYTLVHVAASYQVNDWLQVYGRVENLTDEHYQEVLGYATAGMAGYAGIRLRYQAGH